MSFDTSCLEDDEILVLRVEYRAELWARFLTCEQRASIDGRYVRAEARREAVCCEGALRCALSHLLGTPPHELGILRGPKGKPYVEADLGFSVSHADGLGVLALSRRRRVGVDLEHGSREIDCEAIAEGFFPEKERAPILAAPPERRRDVMLREFTRFEAAAKATGVGLTLPADDYEALADGMLHRYVDLGPGYVCCVVADPPRFRLRVGDASELLD